MTLLRDLDQSLNDIADELSEDGTEASEDNETPAAWPDDDSATELQQLHEELVNIIDCLYQLSMLIRKPAQHDLFVGSRMGDKAEFESTRSMCAICIQGLMNRSVNDLAVQ